MFKSLKSKVFLALTLLMCLLIAQGILTRINQSSLITSLELSQRAVLKVNLVRALERDILDLQRNVLIYKETASDSVVARFDNIMSEIKNNITSLQFFFIHEDDDLTYLQSIERMNNHLAAYQENFNLVVEGRSKRKSLLQQGIESNFNVLQSRLSSLDTLSAQLQTTQYHLSQSHNALLSYLLSPDSQIMASAQKHLKTAADSIDSIVLGESEKKLLIEIIDETSGNLKQLSQLTRGYLYLVNVVMAGSANEFLFLARELNQQVEQKLSATNNQVIEQVEFEKQRVIILSVIIITLSLALAFFFTYRVMLPVNKITDVFKKLVDDKHIDFIPGMSRVDEIGELAKAADVFHSKNLQTTSLLKDAQLLYDQQKKLNEELAHSKQKAEQASASKGIFLANMSHEIRTPMNGIIGMLDVVLNSDITPQQREQLNKVVYSTQILMSLINDILDFSKIEAGKLHLEALPFSPQSLFENFLSNIAIKAQEKNLNIRFHIDPSLPINLIGDPLRITQVLLNLCTNAIKFTSKGKVNIEVSYELEDEREKSLMMTVRVKDTGIGMTETQLANIFDSFTQADGSTNRKYGGTGLGLAIVKQLAKLMSGKVYATSTEHAGSQFDVSFKVNYTNLLPSILSPFSHNNLNIYYLTGEQPLIYQDYIDYLGIPVTQCHIDDFMRDYANYKSQDILIIDLKDLSQHGLIVDKLTTLSATGLKFGFVTETQPNNLANLLKRKWSTETLSHPFTPQHLVAFLDTLINPKNFSDDLDSEDWEVENHLLEGHILLVEDNSINQAVAGHMLASLGLTYDVAEDGKQAVIKVTNSPHYDVILMDIQMPVMDGYQATKELRSLGYKDLVICGLSANALPQDLLYAEDSGMNSYLTKPIKIKQLYEVLKKYLPTQ